MNMRNWIQKHGMLLGITLARWFPFLHAAKMRVGDSMVLACTLTMPRTPDGAEWPERGLPLLVMFRPPKGAFGGELYAAEPKRDGSRPEKLEFEKQDVPAMPLFGGKAFVFVTDNFDRPTEYFVRCRVGDRAVDSGIVVSKIDRGHTPFSQDFVAASPGDPPSFSWPPAPNSDHWIHFLVVSKGMDMLAGIYLRKTSWIYGELGDLPYYIHDPLNTPLLKEGETYDLMYHAVDADGWVTQLCMRTF